MSDDLDPGALYRSIRLRVTDLVRGCTDDQLDRVAPAAPGWRVRDVVAHLCGNTADAVAGNMEGVATDPWTQAQVDARRHTPMAEILDEWERCSELLEPGIAAIAPPMRAMLLTDTVTHEHDVRGGIGAPGARDSDAIAFAAHRLIGALGAERDAAELGALRIVHDAGEVTTGTGPVTATLRTSRFELVRAGVGRRSLDQIAAWDWQGEGAVHPELAVFSRFRPPRATPLAE